MAEVYYIRMPDGSVSPPIPVSIPRDVAMQRINDMMDAQEASLPARAGASFLQGLVQSIPDFTGGLVSRAVREQAPPAIQRLTGVNPEQPPPPRSAAEPYILSAARGAGSGAVMAPAAIGAALSGGALLGAGALGSNLLAGAGGGALGEATAQGMGALGGGPLAQTGARLAGEVAGSMATGAVQRGIARSMVAPLTAADITPDPGQARLIETLVSENVPVRPSQYTGSPLRTRIEQGFSDLPSTTSREQTINQRMQDAYNAAVLRRAGITGQNRATGDVLSAQERELGQKIGDIANRNVADLNQGGFARLMDLEDDAIKNATPEILSKVRSRITQLLNKSEDGVIPGSAWRELNTAIGDQIRRAESGDLKYYLTELRSAMREALAAGIKNPDDLKQFDEARRQYANLVTIETAMGTGAQRQTAIGNITPTSLKGSLIQSQGARAYAKETPDLSDLADAGIALTSGLANSQTAARANMMATMQGSALGGQSATQPTGTAVGTLAAAQLIPKALQTLYYGLPGTTRLGPAGPTATAVSQGLLGTTPARGAALGGIQAMPQAEELGEEGMRSALARNAMERMRGLLQ